MTKNRENEPQPNERRVAQRVRTVFRPAYVRVGSALYFVTMRNVSPEGASFDGLGDVSEGQEVLYCVGDSKPILAKVKWVKDQSFGVENVVERLEDLSFASDKPYRSVRLPVMASVQIYYLGCKFDGFLRNLSQTGACIDSAVFFEPGELLTMQIGGVSIEQAVVKWSEGARAGIRFANALDKETISHALQQLQCRKVAKEGHIEVAA